MDLICIGKFVNTHGIKGEIRIISNFKYKEDVFKKGNEIYINNIKYTIVTYRKHKNFDMVTLVGFNSINEVLGLKNSNVYINREDYKFNGYLDEDLVGLEVFHNDIYKGKIIDVLKTNKDDLLVVDGINKHYVPYIDNFVKGIDLENKKIYIEYIKGLDYED